MSRLFISHNSADNQITEEIRQRLESVGHQCIYVDFDPEQGIAAGQDWERDLYRELRACRALIILCSKASMKSLWCFAEVTNAKSMGKPVIPVKIEECEIHSILSRHQIIDWTLDREQAWVRLQRGLLQSGIDPRDSFNWDGTRPPYPGLMSFQQEDAAIFFGRQKEVQDGLEALNRQHQMGAPRSLMVFGPSGSGKSSLVRAGLVPRLEANEEQWLILDVIRPRGQPLKELAWTLQRAFQRFDVSKTTEGLVQELDDSSAESLCEIIENLRVAANRRDASVLLLVDQSEELISQVRPNSGSEQRFLELVLGAIESDHCALQVVWTLRSDFMAAFQRHPLLRKLKSTDLSLGLMNAADIAQVIERPAALAGVELESGLTQKIITDVQGDDALPLLAFSLRELYERYHQDGLLEIREYDELGGLTGSIARSAERVYLDAGLDNEQQAALRHVFLSMARFGDDGSYVRRVISHDSVPDSLHKVVEAFVRARLLVAGADDQQQTLEVAHEAIFRAWRRLSVWLQDDQEFLRWMGKLEFAVNEWDGEQDRESLLRGKALLDAEYYLKNNPSWSPGDKPMQLIDASRRRVRRQRQGRISLVLMVMVILLGAALWNNDQANKLQKANDMAAAAVIRSDAEAERARRNLYNARLVLANAALNEGPEKALVELQDIARFPVEDREVTWGFLHGLARNGLPEGIELDFNASDLPSHQSYAISPDGKRVAGLSDGHLVIWRTVDLTPIESLELSEEESADAIAWTADGDVILATSNISFYSTDPLVRTSHLELPDLVIGEYLFTRDGRRLIAALEGSEDDCSILIYDMQRREAEEKMDCALAFSEQVFPRLRLSADERWVVLAVDGLDKTGSIGVYDLQQKKQVLELGESFAFAIALSNDPADLKLAWGTTDGRIKIVRIPSGDPMPDLVGHTALAGTLSWSPDDTQMAVADLDHEIRLWNVAEASTVVSLEVDDSADFSAVSFSRDGGTLITRGEDVIHFWDARTGAQRIEVELDRDQVQWVNFIPGEGRVLMGGEDSFFGLDIDPGWKFQALVGHRDPVDWLHFTAVENLLMSRATDDTIRVWDIHSGTTEQTLVGGNEKGIFHNGFIFGRGLRYSALISIDPDGRFVGWATAGGSVQILNIETGQALPYSVTPKTGTEQDESSEVKSLTFSPGSDFLYTLWEDGEMQQLDLNSGVHTNLQAPEDVYTVKEIFPQADTGFLLFREFWSPDRLWRFQAPGSANAPFELPVAFANAFRVISLDGKLLAETVSSPGILKIREMPDGDTMRALSVGTDLDHLFGFSPDGGLLATRRHTPDSQNWTVQIWNWSEGELCAQVEIDHASTAAAISRDNTLLAYSQKERIMLHPLEDCAGD